MTRDELLAERASLLAGLGGPQQVRNAAGRFVDYGPKADRLKALDYIDRQLAALDAAAARAAGTGGGRQVRAVYAGRAY